MKRFAPLMVRLVGLWILIGGLAKLFYGTPANLPDTIRNVFLGPDLNFKAAISVELVVGTMALLLPRLAWPLMVGALVVFIGILFTILGNEHCGCFGDNSPPPEVMLGIDGTLLLLLLLSQPWKMKAPEGKSGAGKLMLWLVLAIAGAAAPWLMIKSGVVDAGAQTGEVNEVSEAEGADANNSASQAEDEAWALPPKDQWPRYMAPNLEDWVGQPIAQVAEVGTWFDTSYWPEDATCILYRNSCDHCAEHLTELAHTYDGTTTYVMIRLAGDEDQPTVVKERPFVIEDYDLVYPAEVDLIIETPAEFVLEEGVVTHAAEGIGKDE